MAAAEAFQLVGQEGLERGSLAVGSTAFGGSRAVVFTRPAAVVLTISMANMGGHGNIRALLRLYLFPKLTLPPTARICKIAALLVKEVELKLERVGVVGNVGEEGGA
ncbi:integrase [Babesia caballi]|uniref:Integrase n=1 Tax=Babesia caballi TaxID=5871 RepID=A0AAV4M3G4_BABCB|nr:integrase [Babesia caballi]